MASSTGDKTEKASSRKLREARRGGQSARSRDVATVVGVLAGLQLVAWCLPGWLDDFRRLYAEVLSTGAQAATLDHAWSGIAPLTLALLGRMLLPLAVVPAVGIVAALVPGGWSFAPSLLLPRLERLGPARYLQRGLGTRHWLEFATAFAKAALLMVVIVHVVRSGLPAFLALEAVPLDRALAAGGTLLRDGLAPMAALLLVFAAIDLPLQVFLFLRGQRMSRREVKDEHRSSEGSPQLRQRIRQLQRQIARRSVRKTVPTADVVIVNPEHYAVALKYDDRRAEAPYVVAKGIDEMALFIRQVAIEHGVEVLPLPPLARAIYATSQVQQQIPAALYQAVAQVLGHVLQLEAFRRGRRTSRPVLPSDLAVPASLAEASASPVAHPTPARR